MTVLEFRCKSKTDAARSSLIQAYNFPHENDRHPFLACCFVRSSRATRSIFGTLGYGYQSGVEQIRYESAIEFQIFICAEEYRFIGVHKA
jgi:hypothetical protein